MNKSEVQIIATNIKNLRIKKGITQKDLASAINVAASQYGRIELGKVMPSLNSLLKIAKILDVTIESLVYENKNVKHTVSEDEKITLDIIGKINQLSKTDKHLILNLIELAIKDKKFKKIKDYYNKIFIETNL